MRSTFKILFYINRQKTKVDGNTATLCRITIDGKNTAIRRVQSLRVERQAGLDNRQEDQSKNQ